LRHNHDMAKNEYAMRIWLALCAGFAVWALALPAGHLAAAAIALLTMACAAPGHALFRFLRVDEPFLEFTTGTVLLSFAAWFGLAWFPKHGIMVFVLLAGTSGLYLVMLFLSAPLHRTLQPWIAGLPALMTALITIAWNHDNLSRLVIFQTSGRLDYWLDVFIHSSKFVELGGELAAGRGNALLADSPSPLYHMASYALPALVMAVANANPLAVNALMWMPLGTLVMATGVAALGHALGGQKVAMWSLPALALVPAFDCLPIFDGTFSASWLLEAGPGAYYGVGASCASLALLILWMKSGRNKLFGAAVFLALASFFIRANFFLWLAPLIFLAAIYEPRRRVTRYLGISEGRLLALATAGLVLSLTALSWKQIANNPNGFLLQYIAGNSSILWSESEGGVVQHAVLALMAPTIVVAMQGVWLPLMIILRIRVRQMKALEPWDSIPFLLMLIATIFLFLGPLPPNGDISEFRHRGGPLLLVVTMVWSVHLLAIVLTPVLQAMRPARRQAILLACGLVPLLSLPLAASAGKVPRMSWGSQYFGRSFNSDLQLVADALREDADSRSRFAVAGTSPQSRLVDDAAIIVAESGVPAFLSSPQGILLRQDRYGDIARQRVAVQSDLDRATSPDELHNIMEANDISHYVVIGPKFAQFDPDRLYAAWSQKGNAIYSRRDLAKKLDRSSAAASP
jgi:hypothetical protein